MKLVFGPTPNDGVHAYDNDGNKISQDWMIKSIEMPRFDVDSHSTTVIMEMYVDSLEITVDDENVVQKPVERKKK